MERLEPYAANFRAQVRHVLHLLSERFACAPLSSLLLAKRNAEHLGLADEVIGGQQASLFAAQLADLLNELRERHVGVDHATNATRQSLSLSLAHLMRLLDDLPSSRQVAPALFTARIAPDGMVVQLVRLLHQLVRALRRLSCLTCTRRLAII